MLQQTQVKTVLPYFSAWMERFPDFGVLAAAPVEEVLRAWEGLGYYSRARNLHRLAQAMVKGGVPTTVAAWRELPGIGPYTAAAIGSIAFGLPEACVDGNVVRILARLTGDGTLFRDSASAAKALGPLAQDLIEGCVAPGDFNEAMMELGATLCTRASPQCLICPVRTFCRAGREGTAGELPRLAPKTITVQQVLRVWCVQDEALLLHRNHGKASRLADMHELPTPEQAGLSDAAVVGGRLLARRRRAITRYQITELIFESCSGSGVSPLPFAQEAAGTPLPPTGLVWVPVKELSQITLSGPHRRWVREILAQDLLQTPKKIPLPLT